MRNGDEDLSNGDKYITWKAWDGLKAEIIAEIRGVQKKVWMGIGILIAVNAIVVPVAIMLTINAMTPRVQTVLAHLAS